MLQLIHGIDLRLRTRLKKYYFYFNIGSAFFYSPYREGPKFRYLRLVPSNKKVVLHPHGLSYKQVHHPEQPIYKDYMLLNNTGAIKTPIILINPNFFLSVGSLYELPQQRFHHFCKMLLIAYPTAGIFMKVKDQMLNDWHYYEMGRFDF